MAGAKTVPRRGGKETPRTGQSNIGVYLGNTNCSTLWTLYHSFGQLVPMSPCPFEVGISTIKVANTPEALQLFCDL